LVSRRKIGMAVDQTPLARESAIDVRDTDHHWCRVSIVYGNLASLEADRVGKVAALEGNDVLRDERSPFEAAAHPLEGLGEPREASLDRTPGSEEGSVL